MQRVESWSLIYGLAQHGAMLLTLINRAYAIAPTLLVVKTTDGTLFGGFATDPWGQKAGVDGAAFCARPTLSPRPPAAPNFGGLGMADGRGGCFLFRFPTASAAEAYRWSRKDDQFQFVGASGFGLGGGGGYGLWLSADLSHGTRCARTRRCV